MARAAWQKTRSALARAPVALTPRGVLVAALALLALARFGYRQLDLVALTLGLAGLGLVASSGLVTGAFALWLRRVQSRAPATALPARLEAGAPLETGFTLPRPRALPFVALDWSWSEPPGAQCRVRARRSHVDEVVTPRARCRAREVVRRTRARDALGLWRFAWQRSEPAAVTILPNVGALRRIDVVHCLSGGEDLPHPSGRLEGDRMEIRRYAPGDPVRNVLWKTYARTRELHVRTPERSLAAARRTLAYLVVGDEDEPAAAALRVLVESGGLGEDWSLGADGVDEVAADVGAALEVIARSGSADARERAGAEGLAAFLDREDVAAARCLLFAPAASPTWVELALRTLAERGVTARFVLAADGAERDALPRPLWHRALYMAPDRAGADLQALSGLLTRISAAGHAAVFADRATGRVFGSAGPEITRLSA